ncbi:MAG: PAS domain S-box protein [Bacteroidetes bacterium]|nr:PAS domain S-box protein [Bacteroidota bacterium]
MKKPVFTDLLQHQRQVAQVISYPIVGLFLFMLAIIYFVIGEKTYLPGAMLVYIAAVGFNMLLFRLHKNLFINFLTLMTLSYSWFVFMICKTGGIMSPFTTAFILLPVASFITSRKQGRLWTGISALTLLLFYLDEQLGIPVENIIPDEYGMEVFSLLSLFTILVITALLSLFVKSSTYQLHIAYHSAADELSKKSQRLEMLANMLNYSSDLMCIVDLKSLRIVDLNPAYREILGFEMEELQGNKFSDFIVHDEHTHNLDNDLLSLKENQSIEFDCNMKCKDGGIKPFNWVGISKGGKLYASARSIKKQ